MTAPYGKPPKAPDFSPKSSGEDVSAPTQDKPVFLPYGCQTIDDHDVATVVEALNSNWLTTGPFVSNFESAFAQHVGAHYAVACSSGTAALHLAAMALHLQPGDQVIVPTITFLATANAARYVECDVVFCDVDPKTGLMTPETLAEAIKRASQPKAVIPVHLGGQSVDMPAIAELARQHGLHIIEDACHALGSTQKIDKSQEASVGSCALSDMSVFSLHPVKTITTGEGGVVTTNSEIFQKRLAEMRVHGVVRDTERIQNTVQGLDVKGKINPWYYEMHTLGYNYRISDINCALGLSQLERLDKFIQRRREIANIYDELFRSHPLPVQPLERINSGWPAWHLYVVLIDFEQLNMNRAELIQLMTEKGIGTQVHYIPVHMQPYYTELYGYSILPGATQYYEKCLSLPLFPAMTNDDIIRVFDTLRTLISPT